MSTKRFFLNFDNFSREGLGCAVVSDTIFVVGGFDGTTFLSSVEKYDQIKNIWIECERMQMVRQSTFTGYNLSFFSFKARSGLSVVSYRGYLYAIGGYAGSSLSLIFYLLFLNCAPGKAALRDVERYDLSTNRWSPVGPLKVIAFAIFISFS